MIRDCDLQISVYVPVMEVDASLTDYLKPNWSRVLKTSLAERTGCLGELLYLYNPRISLGQRKFYESMLAI